MSIETKEKPHFPEREERHALLMYVNNTVINRGMAREEYNSLKNRLVGPGWTVGELIRSEINIGEVKWDGDKLVFIKPLT
jgi:hypothetical protein